MPLVRTIKSKLFSLAIWKMTESPGELSELSVSRGTPVVASPHGGSERRQREFLTTRLLLSTLLEGTPQVVYTPAGKPLLDGDTRHISLTHSASLAAAIVSHFPVGIDTEETSRRVEEIAPRFLSAQELAWTLETPDIRKSQILCWSVKESVFKMIDQPGTDFRSHILIPPIAVTEEGTTPVWFYKMGSRIHAHLNYLFFENNVVTWCVYNHALYTTAADNTLTLIDDHEEG